MSSKRIFDSLARDRGQRGKDGGGEGKGTMGNALSSFRSLVRQVEVGGWREDWEPADGETEED